MHSGTALLTLGMVRKRRLQVVGINSAFRVLIQSGVFPTFDLYGYLLELTELCFCRETANPCLGAVEMQKVFCGIKELSFHTLQLLCIRKASNKNKLLLPLPRLGRYIFPEE